MLLYDSALNLVTCMTPSQPVLNFMSVFVQVILLYYQMYTI